MTFTKMRNTLEATFGAVQSLGVEGASVDGLDIIYLQGNYHVFKQETGESLFSCTSVQELGQRLKRYKAQRKTTNV